MAGFLQVDTTVASLPSAAVADVLTLLAEYMPECPHLEFILKWLRSLCLKHGPALQVCSSSPTPCWPEKGCDHLRNILLVICDGTVLLTGTP